MTDTGLRPDVVDLLIDQHMRIRDLFTEVEQATGDARVEAFNRLVHLLAVHETAEEQIVHPAARTSIEGGDAVVGERLAEEHDAKQRLAAMEKLDPGSPEFTTNLAELRDAVLAHANAEETNEFRYLRRSIGDTKLRAMTAAVKAAEATAPTHPHPGVESAKANLAIGPVAAAFDRAKDLLRDATKGKE